MKTFACVVAISSSSVALAKPVKICTDNNYWYPFTYEEGGKAKGIHIDIMAEVFKRLGHAPEFTPMPWERCLKENGAKGLSDAVVSASYKAERAEFLSYPKDAAAESQPCDSKFKVQCVSYVVVSTAAEKFEFDGDLKKLPAPVRAVQGYSIIKDLEKDGQKVDAAKGDVANLNKLVRDGKGVVVLTAEQASHFAADKEFAGKIRIHKTPVTRKSYFSVFSKKGSFLEAESQAVWDELAKVTADAKLMNEISARYP